jgi:hypothetical protein
MELRAGDVVARNECGDGAAVVGIGDHRVRVAGGEVIGVHEVGVQPLRAGLDVGEQRMRVMGA